jgi:hypothetical protein
VVLIDRDPTQLEAGTGCQLRLSAAAALVRYSAAVAATRKKSFAGAFDELARRPNHQWSDDKSLARFIRKRTVLTHTTPAQVARWRKGVNEPASAVQVMLLRLLAQVVSAEPSDHRRAAS